VLDALFGIVWIVAVTNAMNLLDNMDGLCAGVAAIAAFASAVEMVNGAAGEQAYAAAMAGASVGFLVYNFFPASIFMGDAGSLFLGASLAVLSFAGADSGSGIFTALAVPAFVLLIPLFDTTLVTMSRILSTRSVAQGGRDHTSHRLVAMGFSERQAVMFLWLLAAAGASIPLLTHVGTGFANLIGPLLLIALILLGVQLARVRVYDGLDFSRLMDKSYTPLLVDITYKRRLFEIALDMVLIAVSYYAAYLIRFDRDVGRYTELIDESLPIVIGCQVVSLYVAGVYRGTWRHMSLSDLSTYARGVILGVVSTIIVLVYSYRFRGYSRGVFIIDAMMLGILLVGSRSSFRLVADAAGRRRSRAHPVVIYGAGDGGALVLRELRNNPEYDVHPVAFVDDDASKDGKRMMRVPIVGGIDRMDSLFDEEHPEAVIVSTSKIPPDRLAVVHARCRARSIRVLQLRVNLEEISPSTAVSD
jgi:UDP-GlcNAc:undecaprenyl-phosphate GlcNAc-1-phosphate transferase